MAYSSERSQEARRGFLDPRTKLSLVLILALFVMGGLGGEALRPIKPALSALPFALLLVERQGKRFLRGVLMLAVGYGQLRAAAQRLDSALERGLPDAAAFGERYNMKYAAPGSICCRGLVHLFRLSGGPVHPAFATGCREHAGSPACRELFPPCG